jgi:hypothetical protein
MREFHLEKNMAIRKLLEQIADGRPAYHQQTRVNSEDPIYTLVLKQMPQALQPHVPACDTVTLEGSNGGRQHNPCAMDRVLRRW